MLQILTSEFLPQNIILIYLEQFVALSGIIAYAVDWGVLSFIPIGTKKFRKIFAFTVFLFLSMFLIYSATNKVDVFLKTPFVKDRVSLKVRVEPAKRIPGLFGLFSETIKEK
jgi:hypothetical protein